MRIAGHKISVDLIITVLNENMYFDWEYTSTLTKKFNVNINNNKTIVIESNLFQFLKIFNQWQ